MDTNLQDYEIKHMPVSFVKDCTDAVEIAGKSMQPTIMDGAIAGVDFEDTKFEQNQIFILQLKDGRRMIKRLKETPHGIAACSDNSLGFPIFYIKEEQILGRVKWVFNNYDV